MSTEALAIARGGTRWRRFTLAFGTSFGAIATVMVLMATGVLAAPITLSGTVFQVKADSLVGHSANSGPSFIQYGFVDKSSGGPTGVAVTDLRPGGSVKFITDDYPDGRIAAVVSESGYVPAGADVVVQVAGGNRVIVRTART